MSRRVLLIEDDLFSATVLADGLRAGGWEVEHVANGAAGLAQALKSRPDAVITDLALPGIDGATVTSSIRLAPGRRIPVILVSAREGGEEVARQAGADRFIAKPVRVEVAEAALIELLAASTAPPADEPVEPPLGAVRIPTADVLGAGAVAPPTDSGRLQADWLVRLLVRLYDRRATGVLDIESGPVRAKLFFHRGCPAAARSSEPGTELGRILERLGAVTPAGVEVAVEEARRKRRPLGDQLVASSLVERSTAERALREQIVERICALNARTTGRWYFSANEPMGLAGFEVPAGVAYWRLGGPAFGPVPTSGRYMRLDAPTWAWPLIDPNNELASVHARFVAGGSLADCLEAGDARVVRLLGVLHRFGLVAFVDEEPTEVQRAAGLAQRETAEIDAVIAARHRALVDADHYTLLGVAPGAEVGEIHSASIMALSAANPAQLPTGVGALTRDRAVALFSRVLEAGRVLLDPERRPLYDAMIARRAGWRTEAVGVEHQAVLLAERAKHHFLRGEYVTAAALFCAALRLEGDDVDILAMLGRTRFLACPEDPSAGEAELRKAVNMDPEADYPLYWLARLHYERGEMDAARHLLRRILTHNSEFELAREAMRLLP